MAISKGVILNYFLFLLFVTHEKIKQQKFFNILIHSLSGMH